MIKLYASRGEVSKFIVRGQSSMSSMLKETSLSVLSFHPET